MTRTLALAHSDRRKRPYWRDARLLGKTFLDKQSEHVLVIGKDSWSRQEVVDQLHIGNFGACLNLSKIAAKLQVESLEQLTSRYTMEDLFGEVGFGEITMIALMAAQEAKNKDPMKWIDKKADKIVTLATEKHRILRKREADAKEAAATKQRHAHATRKKAG